MSGTSSLDVTATLETAIRQLRDERTAAEKAYQEQDKELAKREAYLQQTLDGLRGMLPLPSINPEFVERVRDYYADGKEHRQVDAGKKTKLGSGSVSVALRHLEREGYVEYTGKDGKAKKYRKVPQNGKAPASRETVVHVGDGVREGRKLPTAA